MLSSVVTWFAGSCDMHVAWVGRVFAGIHAEPSRLWDAEAWSVGEAATCLSVLQGACGCRHLWNHHRRRDWTPADLLVSKQSMDDQNWTGKILAVRDGCARLVVSVWIGSSYNKSCSCYSGDWLVCLLFMPCELCHIICRYKERKERSLFI